MIEWFKKSDRWFILVALAMSVVPLLISLLMK